MPEARTDTTQTRPPEAGTGGADAGYGKHRGGAAAESVPAQPHGRHRRTSEGGAGAAV
ncbi:hypothetical protein [Streptomyces sp. HB132]|uniref:hypothetical protein n=1 Tax=Streptomyces sp. HB132 TaxID=767388 RepID=UPI00195F7D5D|nr:hypothetical protein [Streptomyces sp. HB132]MBM7438666.1 hypothetical protein [Streptomyces sp. HB132]